MPLDRAALGRAEHDPGAGHRPLLAGGGPDDRREAARSASVTVNGGAGG